MPSDRDDVIFVGGSDAGLSAALTLPRARKRVLVIDAGQRRNRFVQTAHNLLGQDGRAPEAIVRGARAEVAAYPAATFIDGVAVSAALTGTGYTVTLEDGSRHSAARLILATAVEDELPDLPGPRDPLRRRRSNDHRYLSHPNIPTTTAAVAVDHGLPRLIIPAVASILVRVNNC